MPPRGFGIDATTPLDTVREVALAVERAGYDSFWLNGSPPDSAMQAVEAAADETFIPIGTGVLPFDRRPIDLLIDDTKMLNIPQDRFWMGIGWGGGAAGALDTMRSAIADIHENLDVTPMIGAFGPNMTRLAGEIADGVIFTWWFKEAIEESRPYVVEGAQRAKRDVPPIYSYIRCALLPQAQAALDDAAGRYDSFPRFRHHFRKHGKTAHDTVVGGASADELRAGIEREESVLDYSIIRAITADDSVESILELVEACKPG